MGIYYGVLGSLDCYATARKRRLSLPPLADGVNGRLPNLDLVNGAAHITRWLGGVNVRFHNQTYNDPVEDGSITAFRDRYVQRAKGLLQQSHWGATTKPSGPEGLFGQ